MSVRELKKELNKLTKEQLIKHIIELNKKYKPVQEYHKFFLSFDVESATEKFKETITNEFYPLRGMPKMRLSVARKAISEAKKIGLPPEALADLMLFYVETGVQFTNDFGDIDEPFYNSMESMFSQSLNFMQKEGVLEQFRSRAESVVYNTRNIGWGFHDTLGDYFFEFYD